MKARAAVRWLWFFFNFVFQISAVLMCCTYFWSCLVSKIVCCNKVVC